jgi:malonyl-CoA O-methyltransferase
MNFDKSKIKSNFDRACKSYDENAILQKQVAKKLVEFAKNEIHKADRIIDLGCGTGFITGEILSKLPQKEITQADISQKMLAINPHPTPKIIGDIENLPFSINSFDLALSSLSFQWLNDLENTLPKILKTLKNNGKLCFSTLGNGSLKELRESCEKLKIDLSINDFSSEDELKKILQKFNFSLKKEEIILEYQDCFDLLKSMKKIGAGYSQSTKQIGKKQFELLNSFYLKNFKTKSKVFATWQIFYISLQSL